MRSGSFANRRGRFPPAQPRWIEDANRPQKPRLIAATIFEVDPVNVTVAIGWPETPLRS